MGFTEAFARTMELEGLDTFTDDPSDSGGPTKWGVTASVAARYGYPDVRAITRADAEHIAKLEYWQPLRLGQVVDDAIAAELFDTAWLCGGGTAVRLMQQAVCLIGAQYDIVIAIDGRIGPETLGAIADLCRRGKGWPLLVAANGYQFIYLEALAQRRPKDLRFIAGWMRRVATIRDDRRG